MSYTPFSQTKMQFLTEVQKVGYNCASGIITVALAVETDLILFRNPAGSGKLVELFEQVVSIPDSASNVRSVIRIYKNPTITLNGTALGTGGLRNGQAASVLLASSLPTIAARGTLVQIYGVTYNPVFRALDLNRYIEEGDSILLTATPSGAGTNHSLTQAWIEK